MQLQQDYFYIISFMFKNNLRIVNLSIVTKYVSY